MAISTLLQFLDNNLYNKVFIALICTGTMYSDQFGRENTQDEDNIFLEIARCEHRELGSRQSDENSQLILTN